MLSTTAIGKKLERLWPEMLRAELAGETLFPRALPLAPPSPKEMLENFEQVNEWARQMHAFAERSGIPIESTTHRHRRLGDQELPARLILADPDMVARALQREKILGSFRQCVAATREGLPELESWLRSSARLIERNLEDWKAILSVVTALKTRPWPKCYVRELDLPAVDSKFVERHRPLLSQLLTQVLPQERIDFSIVEPSLAGFCARFGMLYDPPQVRFRWLDPELVSHTMGLRDVAVPIAEFAAIRPPVKTVFITENKTNGLSFPDFPGAFIIFGLGYGIESIAKIEWLQTVRVVYWGDIDCHGFAILSRVRKNLPQVRSLLMDEQTLTALEPYLVKDDGESNESVDVSALTPGELAVYRMIGGEVPGRRVRLEQERVPLKLLRMALADMWEE